MSASGGIAEVIDAVKGSMPRTTVFAAGLVCLVAGGASGFSGGMLSGMLAFGLTTGQFLIIAGVVKLFVLVVDLALGDDLRDSPLSGS